MTLVDLIEKHKFIRRLALAWACTIITVVVLRVTGPETITNISTAGASVVIAVIGILTTVVGLYQHHRAKDDG